MHVEFLNLAKIKKCLDGWYDEHYQSEYRAKISKQVLLPEPEHKPDPKVIEGFQKLKARLRSNADM